MWAFVDNDNKMITNSGTLNTANSLLLDVPEGASKLIVNCNKTFGHSIYEISYNSIENFDTRITACENSIEQLNQDVENLQTEISNIKGVTTLTSGIEVFKDGSITYTENPLETVETGFYYTDEYAVYLNRDDEDLPPLKLILENEIFYFNKNDKKFINNIKQIYYVSSNQSWISALNSNVEQTLTNSQTNIPSSYAVYQALQNISSVNVNKFEGNVVLNANPLNPISVNGSFVTLETGFYLCNYPIFYHSELLENIIYGINSIVYYDSDTLTFYGTFDTATYDNDIETDWILFQSEYITNSLVDKRMKIPTAHAVYEALQNVSGSGVTELTDTIEVFNDGTIDPSSLSSGLYYTGNGTAVFLNRDDQGLSPLRVIDPEEIFYFNSEDKSFIINGFRYVYISANSTWLWNRTQKVDNGTLSNNQYVVPTSHAVYQAIEDNKSLMNLTNSLSVEDDGSVTPDLETGFYYSGSNSGYHYDSSQNATKIFGQNEVFYYNKNDKSFFINGFIYYFDTSEWLWKRSYNIVDTLNDSSINTPTCKAVNDELNKIYDLLNGKNKLRMNPQTVTLNGITVTVGNDGLITINGTATSTIHPTNLGKIAMTAGKNYTCNFIYISGSMGSSGGAGMYFSSGPNAYSNAYGGRALQANNRNFALENVASTTGYLYTTINNGQSFTNFKMKVQVVEGTEADYNYSEYTGGVVYHKDIESY